jgi:hypothetical protein
LKNIGKTKVTASSPPESLCKGVKILEKRRISLKKGRKGRKREGRGRKRLLRKRWKSDM